MKKINNLVGGTLSNVISSMEMFYIVALLVLAPLLIERPNTLITWIQYASTAVLQAIALPLLGYTTKTAGEKQEKLLQETHDTVMNELNDIKAMHEDLHRIIKNEEVI